MYEELKYKRLAGIDYGKRRIGLAYSDELHISSNPFGTIENNKDKFNEIKSFFEKERIGGVILGIPYTKDGTETDWIKSIKEFAEELKQRFELPVHFQDEFGTSLKATEYMIATGVKKKKRSEKGSKDKIAACIILSEFMNNL
jgi:putative Holliday junction resolvase